MDTGIARASQKLHTRHWGKPREVIEGPTTQLGISSHECKSQNLKMMGSDPRATYINLKTPFRSSKLAGSGPQFFELEPGKPLDKSAGSAAGGVRQSWRKRQTGEWGPDQRKGLRPRGFGSHRRSPTLASGSLFWSPAFPRGPPSEARALKVQDWLGVAKSPENPKPLACHTANRPTWDVALGRFCSQEELPDTWHRFARESSILHSKHVA